MPQFDPQQLADWIEVRFDRASGPGGQNVNKVSTRASLLFDYTNCPLLTPAQRARITRRCATRLAHDGRLRIVSQAERSQAANRARALDRLVELLAEVLYVAPTRHATKPSAGSQRRRLATKRRRGDTKRQRQSRPGADD